MRFKQLYNSLLCEISDAAIKTAKIRLAGLDWIAKLSDYELQNYKKNHPGLKKSTETYIQKEIQFRRENKKQTKDVSSLLDKYKELHDKKKIQKVDIQQLHPVELEDIVSKAEQTKSRSEQDAEIKKEVKKVYENDKLIVVQPLTYLASRKYGENTKWCTTQNADKFDFYTEKGALYYIIPKDGSGKIAVNVKIVKQYPPTVGNRVGIAHVPTAEIEYYK